MVLREAVHVLFAGIFVYGNYYNFKVLELPDAVRIRHSGSGGQLKYLTIWNMLLQTSFFLMAVLNDVVLCVSKPSNGKHRTKLQRLLDMTFTILAVPVSLFVFILFWTIYAFDRELIFPRIFDAFFPTWLNHIMHTFIAVAVLVELILVEHSHPSRIVGLIGVLAFFGAYLICILGIAYVWDFWTYPFLITLNVWQKTIFFASCVPVVIIFYFLGEFLNVLVWGRRPQIGKKEKMKSKPKKKSS